MKKNFLKSIKFFVLAMLIAVMAVSLISCDKDEPITQGEEITITGAVTNKAGQTTETDITTKVVRETTRDNMADNHNYDQVTTPYTPLPAKTKKQLRY